jgi:hypothetical protein
MSKTDWFSKRTIIIRDTIDLSQQTCPEKIKESGKTERIQAPDKESKPQSHNRQQKRSDRNSVSRPCNGTKFDLLNQRYYLDGSEWVFNRLRQRPRERTSFETDFDNKMLAADRWWWWLIRLYGQFSTMKIQVNVWQKVWVWQIITENAQNFKNNVFINDFFCPGSSFKLIMG